MTEFYAAGNSLAGSFTMVFCVRRATSVRHRRHGWQQPYGHDSRNRVNGVFQRAMGSGFPSHKHPESRCRYP
ncbi:hypothetical protein KCP78_14780 [Salmonella enterica subsp. enterica]|nr:hypothetical protein KCP78_14780 [Salmonella enterica subsp. enterica]